MGNGVIIGNRVTTGNTGDIASLEIYVNKSFGHKFIDNLINTDKYGTFTSFQHDWEIAKNTAEIRSSDTTQTAKVKKDRVYDTLDILLSKVDMAERYMHKVSSKYVYGSAAGSALSTIPAIVGSIYESSAAVVSGIVGFIASLTFYMLIHYGRGVAEMKYDFVKSKCEELKINTSREFKSRFGE